MRTMSRGLYGVMFALVMSVLLIAWGCRSESEDAESPGQEVDMVSVVRDVGRLQLARMSIGKVGTIKDPSFRKSEGLMGKAEALVDKMKVGERIAVYSYDSYIGAYIDLSKLSDDDIKVDPEKRIVNIRLPKVEVATEGRDITLREEHYRVSGMRSDISPSERAALKEQMSREVKREIAADDGLRERLREIARRRAVTFLTGMMAEMGYEARITFPGDNAVEMSM